MSMDPFFPVTMKNLFTEDHIPLNHVALVNANTNKVLGVVSPKYNIIENKDVNRVFVEALDLGELEMSDHFLQGGIMWKRRYILPREQYDYTIIPGDTVGVCLEIFNSYDGKSSYGFNVFGYRWICSNGMVSGKQQLFANSFTHMANHLEKIRASFSVKMETLEKNIIIWKRWAETKFTVQMMKVFLESRKYLTKKGQERVLELYETIMQKENHDETMWGAYNTITYIASHMTQARYADTSAIFSNMYRKYNQLAADMYEYTPKEPLALPK